jgi:glycosyltransferase involved in cell wall biosynthesis
MAAGRPVIATAVGSVPQIVEEGRTGYTVPVGDDQRLVDRLVHLMDHPELRQAMGAQATAKAREQYSLQRMIDRNAAVIQGAVFRPN